MFQTKAITKHYPKPGVDATIATDYLSLGSGHNDMSKTLADFLMSKFKYEVDVVSFQFLLLHTKLTLFTKILFTLFTYYYKFENYNFYKNIPGCEETSEHCFLQLPPNG